MNENTIPKVSLPQPYSSELYAFCKKLEEEVGLCNGATALFWNLESTISKHLRVQAETFEP